MEQKEELYGNERAYDRGRKAGRIEGEKAGKVIVINNMIKNGMTDEQICALAECEPELVALVRNLLGSAVL